MADDDNGNKFGDRLENLIDRFIAGGGKIKDVIAALQDKAESIRDKYGDDAPEGDESNISHGTD